MKQVEMQKHKVVGEYALSMYERLSNDGNTIVCLKCGKPRYTTFYSPILKRKVWHLAKNKGEKAIEVGFGCDCMEKFYERKNIARREYEEPEYETDKNGKLILKRPQRSFARDYGKRWMLESVPEWGLTAGITDRFYFQRWNESLAYTRILVDNINEDGKHTNDVFIEGASGTLKTSLLCCIRFALLSNTCPTVMAKLPLLMKYKHFEMPQFDIIHDVDYLLLDDIGKARLTDAQSATLEELLDYRRRTSKVTFLASSEGYEGLKGKGYSDSVVELIRSRVDDSYHIYTLPIESEGEDGNIIF